MPTGRAAMALALGATLAMPAALAQEVDEGLHLGGAVRFTTGWRDYGPSEGDGDVDLELLRVDVRGRRGAFEFSAQYRWYETFDAIHHAWVGWRLDEGRGLRLGVQQVPIGLLPTASHGFWFGSGYYLGVEDDYDLGLVWRDIDAGRSWHVGLFAADEYGTGWRYGRYSFDVASVPGSEHRERERLVLRHARRLERGGWDLELGGSAALGRIEARPSGRHPRHALGALHAEAARGPLSLQLQWLRYGYSVDGERIALAAFDAPFEIAARADVYTANLAYAFDMDGRWLDALTCYNDFSTTRPRRGPGLADSYQNVLGCSFGKGPMLTYVDLISGRNMWFVGGPGVGIDEGDAGRWHSRLNINLGFYF
ncbi:hypothetical protein [Coralloluteibacterium thermophilus]|uniref:Uncharacterized protein n=1 Tax=Coralloluteibacterium thermophilum TaxID=2707049 RepID=A0ABV9NMT2_9GAMM